MISTYRNRVTIEHLKKLIYLTSLDRVFLTKQKFFDILKKTKIQLKPKKYFSTPKSVDSQKHIGSKKTRQ